ncbi:hypothetical protein AVEN_96781-1 [Araneus ventricosus]|uniref:Uncharacterized protein n=1 Tax=Araneus ventricosus TaxID=182803 RepID=A0A4Y2IMM9_ARAVE|nr:hypothetical protein AVEN_96781-1 [Araneus ventricosus]
MDFTLSLLKFVREFQPSDDKIFQVLSYYQTWDIPNSTHINEVPVHDVTDAPNDLRQANELRRYFSSKKNAKPKQKILNTSLVEILFVDLEALFNFTVPSSADHFFWDYALPMIKAMMENPDTACEIREIVYTAKRIYAPLEYQMLKKLRYKGYNSIVFRHLKPAVDEARFKLYTETQPIISRILERHLLIILFSTADNLRLIMDTLDSIKEYSEDGVKDLKHHLWHFFPKYSKLFSPKDLSFRSLMTFAEKKKGSEAS